MHDDHVTDITCESTTLAPAEETGDSTTCTGTYTITAADGTAGSVTNTATATGTANGGTVTSPETYQTVPVGQPPLTLHKKGASSGPFRVGSRVRYEYTVTNTGSTPLHDVHVADHRVATVTCDGTTLAPGASTTCQGTYQITRARHRPLPAGRHPWRRWQGPRQVPDHQRGPGRRRGQAGRSHPRWWRGVGGRSPVPARRAAPRAPR
ncbi:hypothetical protein [Streptomyces sp. NPDC001743]|uniref:DUF7507 domain-containing protein n=1 Tax=Streptomyces sp. NPDC001743 TaxID=3154397 RepID=UPI00331AD1F0